MDEPFVIRRGSKWAGVLGSVLIVGSFALISVDQNAGGTLLLGLAPVVFANVPRSWTAKLDGSVTYKDRKTTLVFRPAPIAEIKPKSAVVHIEFKTGRILDFPTNGLRKSEKKALLEFMSASLV